MNGDNGNGLIVFALVLATIALAVATAALAVAAVMVSILVVGGGAVAVTFIVRRFAQARLAARDQQAREAATQLALLLGRPVVQPTGAPFDLRTGQVAEQLAKQLAQLLSQPLDPHTRQVAEQLALLLGHPVSSGFGPVAGEPQPRRWVRSQPASTNREAG